MIYSLRRTDDDDDDDDDDDVDDGDDDDVEMNKERKQCVVDGDMRTHLLLERVSNG